MIHKTTKSDEGKSEIIEELKVKLCVFWLRSSKKQNEMDMHTLHIFMPA